ncbi:MAG: zinc ribbon domain-containing protein [Candidatus Thorarchaeota archaeon]|nr:zinc ribbon domain-containing protein [Candidatus Thorarchaeota archaeon]
MMKDDAYDYHDNQQGSSPGHGRWIVFLLAVALAIVLTIAMLSITTAENYIYAIFWVLPMVVLLLYAAYRWAQGRSVAPTDVAEDSKIFAQMSRHALVAEHVGDLDMYRCPDCGLSFELTNAIVVDDKVVNCPFCNTRLYIE